MGARHEQVADAVLFFLRQCHDAAPAAVLEPIRVKRHTLYVAIAGDGDGHVLAGDQVLHLDFVGFLGDDAAASFVAMLALDAAQLGDDDICFFLFAGQDSLQTGDLLFESVMLLLQFDAR